MATEASLLKWKWNLLERAKSDTLGLSKLQKDVAYHMLSPLPTDLEMLTMVPLFFPS